MCLLEQGQELTYYASENETATRGVISMAGALVSNITKIRDRENSFSLQTAAGRTYLLSGSTQAEAVEWQQAFIEASRKTEAEDRGWQEESLLLDDKEVKLFSLVDEVKARTSTLGKNGP